MYFKTRRQHNKYTRRCPCNAKVRYYNAKITHLISIPAALGITRRVVRDAESRARIAALKHTGRNAGPNRLLNELVGDGYAALRDKTCLDQAEARAAIAGALGRATGHEDDRDHVVEHRRCQPQLPFRGKFCVALEMFCSALGGRQYWQ